MMNILPFLHFFVFLVYSCLLVFLLWKNPKSLLNRVCAALLACFVVWSFTLISISNPSTSKDTIRLFDNVGSLGWISFASFFLWFSLIFTEKKKILKTRIIYLFIFILPLLLIYKQWTGLLTVGYIQQSWGWKSVWSESIWTYLFYLYYLLFIAIGLYLTLNFGRKTEEPLKKKQAKIIFITALLSLVFSTLTDVIFPELNIGTLHLSSLGNVITLIWAFGMVYAIAKYKLMVITPAAAAGNIISSMVDSLILLDREGNIATVNKATLDLSGYGKDELTGKPVELFFKEKDFKNTLLDKTIKKEVIRNYELNFITKTGDHVPVIFSSSTMMDEAGGMVGIVCIISDITERKQAEEAMKKTVQVLNDTGKMAKVGGWELDLSTQEVSWTEEVGRIHGVEPGYKPKLEEALNFYAPEFRSFVEETVKKAAETGEPYDYISLFIPSGSKDKIWVRSLGKAVYQDGKIVKLVGTFQDIDKQKRAEEKLLASESRYRRLVENANEVILVAQDGIIKFVNPIASELIGYSNQELLSRSFLEFIHPDDRNMVGERYLRRLKGDVSQPRYDFRLVTRDSSIKWVEIGVVLIDWEGRPASLNFLTDITERKQAQKALQEAHDQLEDRVARRTKELQHANLKLQELDRLKNIFIASMSHELRTPLALIIGFTDIILQEISGKINQEQRRQFTLVKKNASHLLSLISDILDVNKIEAGKAEVIIEAFDLSALSQEVKDNFTVVADKKGLKLSLDVPPTLPLESDRRRTKQILVNLLSNALKFTDRGEIKIKVIPKEQTVAVSVIDTGSGIKKEDMPKLFHAFSQIPNQGKTEEGTGLGLYLSKKNAHLLGGDICFESEFGKGSVFTLTLPLKHKEA